MAIGNQSPRGVKAVLLMSTILTLLAGCGGDRPEPPVARVEPHSMTIHGDTRVDDYYWLNQRDNPEVIAYLEAENAYLDAMMKDTATLQHTLFEEMKGRIKKDDSSVPYEKDGYWYYSRYVPGGEYALHCRRPGAMEAAEEVLLDGNAMGRDEGYFSLRGVSVSPDTKQLVYGVDTQGRRLYTLHFKNLETGELAPERIPGSTGNVVWANDNQTVFYGRQDPETLRSYQIWRHAVGSDPAGDTLVYQEDDDTFSCYVRRSRSDRYLYIISDQTLSSEVRLLEADDPFGEFRVFQPRQRDVEYHISHQGDRFLVHTNLHAPNFRLMECGLQETWLANWREVVPHRTDVLLEDVDAFTDWLVLTERRDGLSHLRIVPMDGAPDHDLDFGEPTWSVWSSFNPNMDTDVLRFGYESLTTPTTTYAYDMRTREKTVLKQEEVLGGFDAGDYVAEYLHAPARDGVQVPISLVRRKDTPVDGTAPLLLYAYGSYGLSSDAGFDSGRLSLLDRGFIYAIAHIRGGQEMGRWWYEDGKLLKKMNTFTDFIDCGHYLVDRQYARPDGLFAYGGSAGGLLMGAIVNLDPDLWAGVTAAVPFVDVVTTMLDESIPLTTGEFDEWGNPKEKVSYDYMLSYSPYDQVGAHAYPPLLVTTGLHDSQVQYFEPAKWVAKLRAKKTDTNPLLFKTNMEAGHGGKSGRFRRLEEKALMYAFFLDLAGRN
ncbi:S9 family peptidase [bacterium]|nr:S9 family peptidase [bacterium]